MKLKLLSEGKIWKIWIYRPNKKALKCHRVIYPCFFHSVVSLGGEKIYRTGDFAAPYHIPIVI